ncbi:Spb1 C-terminal domain-containing protein [Gorgonomyces haynaldii]|nr:Spb1 C-terminal domain-containing protein [Gorgonomyces haynaldii]
MAVKKHAKGRLDKYYHMAKEQGYRARSAFKLIQLNKKYNFLEKAKVTVDLCAAPGGWCQVAAKYMPKPSIIIGLDLAPIKPIPGVITHVEDITTSKCRSTLKKELKTWKADVFLHDGAPNVGTSWLQDAFTQSELTLSALKLATEFLAPGGTFVTKVFRSKDYNKLIWIFNQLFKRVEATKPTASRNVSAEIFVVCSDYFAPKKIDPKLLDPKYAFKELDDTTEELDPKKIKEKQGQVINDLFHPQKRKRHREGYEDGDYTLHTQNKVSEFVESSDFLGLLVRSASLAFGDDEFSQSILNHPLTTSDIKESFNDLKVLGKKEFKTLIKWRDQIRVSLGLVKEEVAPEPEPEKEKTLEELIEEEKQQAQHRKKIEKKKKRERKAKTLLKMQLGMQTPEEIGIDANKEDVLASDFNMGHSESESEEAEEMEDEEESVYDSDDERMQKIARLDQEADKLYQQYRQKKVDKNPSLKVKQQKEGIKQEFQEWYGIEADKKMQEIQQVERQEQDSSSDSEDDEPQELSSNAKLFFDNPLFKQNLFDEEMVSKPTQQLAKFDDEEEAPVPAVPVRDEDDDLAIDSAQAYTMAQQLLRGSTRRDLVDNAFNRYAHNDPEGLPEWFTSDENQHNKPDMPVTKEAVLVMKQRMKAMDARPIKKVAEAKFRKQMRQQRRLEKSLQKAEGLSKNDDMSEKTKLEAISKLMSKAKNATKKERKKPSLVVAKGFNRGVQGRPKGVKGRYKMVDGRMKKEVRAENRAQKKKKRR